MEPTPPWTSLVVARSIIPYDDLQISPGYGRNLLTPDDVPPVLALPWALGPTVPRANRAQDDGSLNVHVTNAGSGGTGPYDLHTSWVQGMNEGFAALSDPISVLYKLVIVGTYPDTTEYTVLSGIPFYLSATDDQAGIVLIARDPGMTYHNTITGQQMLTWQMDWVGGWNLLPLLGGSPAQWLYVATADALYHNLMLWGT